jgi:glucose/arabinose dehydrogenase
MDMRNKLAVLLFLAASPAAAEPRFVRAFPKLSFENPLFLAAPPDGSSRLFVAEQDGRIRAFPNRPDAAQAPAVLDISAKVRRVHNEEGLLGFAFHPKFAKNGLLFVQYSATPRRNVISRFTWKGKAFDPASEKVVLEVDQPYGNHNGGMLAFGPDGFLYVGLGDGGSAGDPQDRAQDKGELLGKILRLDVDGTEGGKAYRIPRDNPFTAEKGARPEIWAWGLRNPWRFSFDRQTGELWAGDVGQDKWEEVDVIKKGLNYGWNRWEGDEPYERGGEGFEPPVAVHGREEAQSITGGYVYRGKKFPALTGSYIYGDFMSGQVWVLKLPGKPRPIAKAELISSFGEDESGELYLVSFDGNIYSLRD